MQRFALGLAIGAVIAALVPSPGLFVALGLGLAAIGTGWVGYRQRAAPGGLRLVAAGAITLGAIGLLLGTLRVVLVIAALDHVGRMIG
ncbi:MAG: hypothetical protein SFX73_36715 [Kofleriaceae bacterium]|nr:hypothetical protein [Kofleriaceae bacterium]